MSYVSMLVFLFGAWALSAGLLPAQSVSADTYDFNFIGQPLADPTLQHAKETYVLFGCAYCHGIDLVSRGEATDLMHSRLVGRDVNGNLIGPLLRAGIPQTAKLSPMPQFSDLSDQQIGALVRWIHYARAQGRFKELVNAKAAPGNGTAGKTYFDQNCSSCHTTGDLARVAKEYREAEFRSKLLNPTILNEPPTWKAEKLHEVRLATAQQRHQALLETYSSEEIANLMTFLLDLKGK
jgi:mono/diheme cytochrome c family protein